MSGWDGIAVFYVPYGFNLAVEEYFNLCYQILLDFSLLNHRHSRDKDWFLCINYVTLKYSKHSNYNIIVCPEYPRRKEDLRKRDLEQIFVDQMSVLCGNLKNFKATLSN